MKNQFKDPVLVLIFGVYFDVTKLKMINRYITKIFNLALADTNISLSPVYNVGKMKSLHNNMFPVVHNILV